MRKIITVMILAILFVACKSKSAINADDVKIAPVTTTKLDRSTQVAIKGNWVIASVTYPGSNFIKVNSFQIADSKCFEGSTWNFISNNNKGSMALTKTDCTAFSSPIVWSVNKSGQFVLKILNAGEKAKKVRDGYVLSVANQTETSFQLVDKINVGGQEKDVVYQFQKQIN
jgi:PBP1b-binding outer membrane lipoprotein LpoB